MTEPETLGITPSQTIGPFLSIALDWEDGPFVVPDGTRDAIRISGTVRDGEGKPVTDSVVETWQADGAGSFTHPDDPRGGVVHPEGFRGFGRSATDGEGRWSILTVVPGPLPLPDGGVEAPHIDVSVFARGLLDRVVTRIYFPEHEDAFDADPVLCAIDADRRSTVIATAVGDHEYRFDIKLQGEGETVFFAV